MEMLNKNCYIKDKYQNLIVLCMILGLGILFQY